MKQKSMKVNFIYNLVFQTVTIMIPFVTAPYLTRTLAAESLGIYTYTNSIVQYFILFAALGFSVSGTRSVARTRDSSQLLKQTSGAIYAAQFLVGNFVLAIYVAICCIWHLGELYWIFGLLIISEIFNVRWLFNGCENFKTPTLVNTICKIVLVVLIFTVIRKPEDLLIYSFIMAMSSLSVSIILFFQHRNICKFELANRKTFLFQLKESLTLFVPVIASGIYTMMDKIMLGAITSDMVGVSNYYYAEQLIGIPSGIIIALSSVVLPRMSNNYVVGHEKGSQELARLMILLTSFLSCAIACGLAGISTVFVPLFLGQEYISCGTYVIFLAITSIETSWITMMRTLFLIPMRRDSVYILSVVLGVVVNIVLNAILIKPLGVNGAIIGTIVAELTIMILQTVAVYRMNSLKRNIFESLPFLAIGIIMALLCYLMGKLLGVLWTTAVIQILVGAAFYLSLSFVYIKFFHKDVLDKAIMMLKKKR